MDQQVADANVQRARANLKGRLEALERRVVGTTEEAVDHVKETAHTVRTAVSGTVDEVRSLWENVSDGVQHSLDISSFVKTHPWQTLTLAAGTGFFAGFIIRPSAMFSSSKGQAMGIVSDLLGVLRKELMSVGEATIAAGAAAIKQNLSASFPQGELAGSGHGYSNGRH